jgi:predicted phage terminase large subunit-like protein
MPEQGADIGTLREAQELFAKCARQHLYAFLPYSDPSYQRKWFHTLIADKCQAVYEGKIKRLMIFVPPQHGKSEVVSRRFPAWAMGNNPNLKIIGCSYSIDLARGFCRSIQRTIDTKEYSLLFPETRLNRGTVRTDAARGWTRNADMFEVVGKSGFYKAVGVTGSLTGTPADIAIIDDPVKDAIEAYSRTYRERVWDWYLNVLLTRLHNESRQILVMTRWHVDDLAGRILEHEADKWEVLRLPAVCEDATEKYRQPGEALWEERHSLARLREIEVRSPRTFASLYQQRPVIEGGNIIQRSWFNYVSASDFERIRESSPITFFTDTAYTDNTANDPTGTIGTCSIGNDLYISCATKVYKKFPDLIRFLPGYVRENGYTDSSTVRIEPKANGLSVIDQLREGTGLNVTKTPSPKESKETRLNVASPFVESGRVYLVAGAWNESFIEEVCAFPVFPHDEYVDLLCYAIDYHIKTKKRTNNNNLAKLAKKLY